MDISAEQFDRWKGIKAQDMDLCEWEEFALDFFHKKEFIKDPWLQLTIRLDITKARKNYIDNYKWVDNASLTAWLSWNLIRAMKDHPWSRMRKIKGEWHCFENLPLFFPVAIGGSKRFFEPVIDDPVESSWEELYFK